MQNLMGNNWNSFIIKLSSFLVVAVMLMAYVLPSNTDYKLLKTIPIEGKFITTDHLNNSYIIDNKNQVMQFDSSGTLIGRYSNNKYGQLSTLDATSPFNLVLFYKDFSTALTADNRLTVKTLYKFPSIGASHVSAACLSNDNYIWFYDQREAKLKKVNSKYTVIQESQNMNQMLGLNLSPNFMIERNDFVFVGDPNLGIIMFDLFGNYYRSFPISGLTSFQVLKNNIVYYDAGKLKIFNYIEQEVSSVDLPISENILGVRLLPNRLYILTNEDLKIYGAD